MRQHDPDFLSSPSSLTGFIHPRPHLYGPLPACHARAPDQPPHSAPAASPVRPRSPVPCGILLPAFTRCQRTIVISTDPLLGHRARRTTSLDRLQLLGIPTNTTLAPGTARDRQNLPCTVTPAIPASSTASTSPLAPARSDPRAHARAPGGQPGSQSGRGFQPFRRNPRQRRPTPDTRYLPPHGRRKHGALPRPGIAHHHPDRSRLRHPSPTASACSSQSPSRAIAADAPPAAQR